jgi:hypothetical protein
MSLERVQRRVEIGLLAFDLLQADDVGALRGRVANARAHSTFDAGSAVQRIWTDPPWSATVPALAEGADASPGHQRARIGSRREPSL